MTTLVLTLTNGEETADVEFEVLDTDIAQRWSNEVAKNYPLYETNRFKGWPNSEKTISYYHCELRKQIGVVNEYRPNTISVTNEALDQETLNRLHKFFEELRGPLIEETEFYKTAPDHVKDAILTFNILIHELEHLIRNPDYPTIVCTFKQRPRIDLEEADYDKFTFKWKFGYVYINYCEVGKPLLDVFKDQDEVVGIDNIRPLKYYSADFMIKFGPDTPDEVYTQRLKMFHEWYNKQPYKFPKLSLGLIPVAKLMEPSDNIVETISRFNQIKNVCIK